jgi:hypothetical protein
LTFGVSSDQVAAKLLVASASNVPKAGPHDFVERTFKFHQEIAKLTLAENCHHFQSSGGQAAGAIHTDLRSACFIAAAGDQGSTGI